MAISTNLNHLKDYLPLPIEGRTLVLKRLLPLKSTAMVTGMATKASLYFGSFSKTPVSWIFTDGQAQLFEARYRDIVRDGAGDWFNMPPLPL